MRTLLSVLLILSLAACGEDPGPSGGPLIDDPGSSNNGQPDDGETNNAGSNNGGSNNATVATNNGTTAANNGTVATNNGTSVPNNGTVATNNGTTSGPDDLPSGEVCPLVNDESFRGFCDVVRNEGCEGTEQCLIAQVINGPDVDISSYCVETDRHSLPEGANCDGTEQRCAPGLFCMSFLGTCQKLCYFDGGVGCEPDEWCNQADEHWIGVGYCNDQCDPLD